MGQREDRLVESVLFSASQPVSIAEIQAATELSRQKVRTALESLIHTYNEERKRDTSLEVIRAGDKYIMQVKKRFTEQSMMIAQPEIDDNLLRTLTLIAFHQPIKQSNLRRMLGEKIYEHVDELVSMRLVHTKPHGSTEMLTTTKRFPEYFGINSTKPEEIREFLIKKVTESTNK